MARRKKIKLKKLPVSEKKFKELKHVKSRQILQKEAQVRQRLEHRPNINRNINELIEQLYFPDLRMQDAMSAQNAFKVEQLQAEAEMQKLVSRVSLHKLLQSDLNSQLLQTYSSHKEQLQINDIIKMVRRFKQNSLNIEVIKKRRLERWERYADKMKQKNIPVKNTLKFIEVRDVEKHNTWKQLLTNITTKVNEVPTHQLKHYIDLALYIHSVFGLIPQQYFYGIMKRFYKEQLNSLDLHTKTLIIRLLCRDSKVKLSSMVSIAGLTEQNEKLLNFGSTLVKDIVINHKNELDVRCAIALIESIRLYKKPFLNRTMLAELSPAILKHVANMKFEKVVDVFCVYHQSRICSKDLAELLKFDILRKLQAYSKIRAVLEVLNLIQKRQIKFQQFSIEAADLLPEISQAIIEQLRNHRLDSKMLLTVLDKMFYNGYGQVALYQLISAEISKRHSQMHIPALFNAFFKLTLMSVDGSQLRDICLNRAGKEYRIQMKRLAQDRIKYLPSVSISEKVSQTSDKPSEKEVELQQALILFIWAYIKQAKSDNQIDLDALLQIIPKNVLSDHLLINELCRFIEAKLSHFRMFPKMKLSPINFRSQSKLNSYYLVSRQQSEIEKLLRIEASISGKFYRNYSSQDGIYLHELWSDTNAIDSKKYLQWLRTAQPDKMLFGTPKKETKNEILNDLFERRKKLITQIIPPVSIETKQSDTYQLSEEEA